MAEAVVQSGYDISFSNPIVLLELHASLAQGVSVYRTKEPSPLIYLCRRGRLDGKMSEEAAGQDRASTQPKEKEGNVLIG